MRVAQYIDGEFSRIIQLPKDWKNILNFHKKSETDWNAEGFYRVVEPTINPATEKKGVGYLDGNVYTYAVESKTQEEQDSYNESQINSDLSQQAINQRRADGIKGFDRIKAIIERKYRTGEITANQAKNADAYFHPLIKDLNFGSWIIVKGLLDAEASNVPTGYQSLFNTIKSKVDSYIQNNY
jgi:hypothetical protein